MLRFGSDIKDMMKWPGAGLQQGLGQQETSRAGLQCLLSRKIARNEAHVVGLGSILESTAEGRNSRKLPQGVGSPSSSQEQHSHSCFSRGRQDKI